MVQLSDAASRASRIYANRWDDEKSAPRVGRVARGSIDWRRMLVRTLSARTGTGPWKYRSGKRPRAHLRRSYPRSIRDTELWGCLPAGWQSAPASSSGRAWIRWGRCVMN